MAEVSDVNSFRIFFASLPPLRLCVKLLCELDSFSSKALQILHTGASIKQHDAFFWLHLPCFNHLS
jgi:hypothetical protein